MAFDMIIKLKSPQSIYLYLQLVIITRTEAFLIVLRPNFTANLSNITTTTMFNPFKNNIKFLASAFMASAFIAAKPFMCAQQKKKKYDTYIWGNGYYQARPDAILQFKNFTPKRIKNLPDNLAHIEFGEFYDAGIDETGNLFIWDSQNIDANFTQQRKEFDETRQNLTKLEAKVKEVKFTTGYIWVLTDKKEVIQYPIIKQFDKENNIKATKLGNKRTVDPLKGTIRLDTGNDHVIVLKQDGQVYAMGDDTFGQCGQDDKNRNTHPPFTQNRIKYPVQVKFLKNIVKIAAGGNHNLALDHGGNLFGWGSNSSMQLSHEDEFSAMNTPLICTYKPIKIYKGLDSNEVRDLVTGDEFSVFITTNRNTESQEVFTVGSNLKGQLGIGQIRHIRDITKVEALSNYVMKIKGKQEKVKIQQLRCGKNHCIALLNIGYIMEWGDNEYGQMGNKKRSGNLVPIVIKDFAGKKVVGVFAGDNKSGVIIEHEE